MPRRKVDSHDDGAPRPLIAYLLLAVVVVVVVAGAYLGRDAITAFVADTFVPNTVDSVSTTAVTALPEPACAADCGRACWLVASGSAEGDYASAHGAIGTLGCDGACWSVADAAARCCRNSDCPKDTLCSNGVC